jgi:hypothetical protein
MMLKRPSRSFISPLPLVEAPVGVGRLVATEAISDDIDAKKDDIADAPGRVGTGSAGNWRFSSAKLKFVCTAARAATVELVSTLIIF